ncbi:TRAP transporter small permease subunit [Endozoicomonas sp. G2_1]|uniref:TRAP transporter small permease subunit n=1 Tax=Endozoicomonas sp. G2_1 TaxID=2821091 RepID=UPI001ADA1ED9|nr:TRAP transporter small permease subunit [Endozoicomonas sp. G2_1]MBO9488901.1 TRAP transporter small permease subunit [Endozoicomonas sp. G2_1]
MLTAQTSGWKHASLSLANKLEKLIIASANLFCWSSALLILVIIVNVVMRYGFNNGLILFEEIQWHLYAIGIMFGLSYAEITNSQVRVDVIASRLKPSTVIKWEIFGALFFALPMVYVVAYNSIDYVATAYRLNESSVSPLGLPYRWLIKAVIPSSFIMLALAVIARMIRNVIQLLETEN